MELYERLKIRRAENNYTQKEVADIIGVDVTTYAHYESGRRSPDIKRLQILCNLFNISIEEHFPLIKQDIVKNITKICNYHNIAQEISYRAILKIESVLDFITHFYEFDYLNDKSAKKALVLEFINSEDGNGFLSTFNAFDSSIEKLLFMALKNSMPEKIFQKAYLMPQVQVCDKKYVLDIALMERVNPKTNNGSEGVPVIGIECNGYNYHYADPNQATSTAERIREIEMFEGIRVFQYTGKEIYSRNTELAEEFWEYVCDKIYTED